MRNNIKTIIGLIFLICLVGVSAYYYGYSKREIKEVIREINLTQNQVDSLKKTIKPIEKEVIVYKDRVRVLREEELKIEYDSVECNKIVSNLKEQIANQDTIIVKQDSIVYIDREIIRKQDVIIDLKPMPKSPKRFGVGIQAGYGISGKEVKPYIGVGVSYNLIRF